MKDGANAWVCLPTGSDSPVRAASCARKLALSNTRPSAGTNAQPAAR